MILNISADAAQEKHMLRRQEHLPDSDIFFVSGMIHSCQKENRKKR